MQIIAVSFLACQLLISTYCKLYFYCCYRFSLFSVILPSYCLVHGWRKWLLFRMLNDKLPGKCLGVQKQTSDDGEDSVGDDDFWCVWWRWRWRWRRYSGGGVGNNINDNNPCSNSLKPPFKPRTRVSSSICSTFSSRTSKPHRPSSHLPVQPPPLWCLPPPPSARRVPTRIHREGVEALVSLGDGDVVGGGLLWDDDREGAKWYKMENKKGGEGEIQFRSRLARCFADVLQAF